LLPTGDQPRAIEELVAGVKRGDPAQVLLGITGSGKTFTMAHVIAQAQRPTLVMAHNKTLAHQLYGEFKSLFPDNAVHFFVSYYDYYQPEAYVPSTDTYIEKDSLINEEIDRMRHAATYALLTRRDVIIVASVSCIYGIGAPEAYLDMKIDLAAGVEVRRDAVLRRLIEIQYERNDMDFSRGKFRVRGDVVEIFPAYEREKGPARGMVRRRDRDHFRGGSSARQGTAQAGRGVYLSRLALRDPERATGASHEQHQRGAARTPHRAARGEPAGGRTALQQRTLYDLEMLEQMGRCKGIENYSRHLSGRKPGEPPPTLLDYFPEDCLTFVDESHQSVPQIGSMHKGDRSRKQTLVDFGFRLPSALDNRPLRFEEWEARIHQVVFVSATPRTMRSSAQGGCWSSRSFGPPGCSIPRSRSGRWPRRSTTCWARSARGSLRAIACWSPR
jgi:excinuclease ABC subunit B